MQSVLKGSQKQSLNIPSSKCSEVEVITAVGTSHMTLFLLLFPLYVNAFLQMYFLFTFWHRQTSCIDALRTVTIKVAERGVQHTVDFVSTFLCNFVESLSTDDVLESQEALPINP